MPYSSARGANPRIIVLHTGEGILDRFDMVRFLDDNSGASAHAVSDAGGAEGPLVPYDRAAWTAGPTANSIGLHIEMCAFAQMTREQWLSETDVTIWVQWLNNGAGGSRTIRSPKSMLRWTAQWVRSIAAMYDIPLVKLSATQVRNGQRGVCGHADTSAAFGETDHTDPGDNFPWDVFMALAQGMTQEDDLSAAAEQQIAELYRSAGAVYTATKKDWSQVLIEVDKTNAMILNLYLGAFVGGESTPENKPWQDLWAQAAGKEAADVDEEKLAAILTPALLAAVTKLSDGQLNKFVQDINDERDRRERARLEAEV